jgi:SAM-dependent methyltransferase
MNLKIILKKILRPNGKVDFLSKLCPGVSILDVGCGNNSPFDTKIILPNCNYTGIDIDNYNQVKPLLADNYFIVKPQNFSNDISDLPGLFDVVISSHNLEHCHDRKSTLEAMMSKLKIGGKLFLSFPCESSINFPKRDGSLNYYDDLTHEGLPPSFAETLKIINGRGFKIDFAQKNYSPAILRLVGLVSEPISKLRKKIMIGTWEYYGFESIIIATKLK